MNARILSSCLVLAVIGAALWPTTARAVDVANGMISIENPTTHAIKVTITSEAGQTETIEVGAYRRVYANRCCYHEYESYEMTAVYTSRTEHIAPARAFLWLCPRSNGHAYGYARVILSTVSGRPILNPVHDGTCYNGP
jgi:hypothetical protein